jgi:Ring finger domain
MNGMFGESPQRESFWPSPRNRRRPAPPARVDVFDPLTQFFDSIGVLPMNRTTPRPAPPNPRQQPSSASSSPFATAAPSSTTPSSSNDSTIPPASVAVVNQLPIIVVRPEDLVEDVNRHCACCLEDIAVNAKVARLPCAHVFHTPCIRQWLLYHHCTCPICRYELPTDDVAFERGRLQRRQLRKPRFSRHDLQRLTISQLKQLLYQHEQKRRQGNVSFPSRNANKVLARFVDKTELMDYIIECGAIDFVPDSTSRVAHRLSDLRRLRPSDLRRTMNEAGVYWDSKDVLEKDDLIRTFVQSGRLHVLPENENSSSWNHKDEKKQESTAADDRRRSCRTRPSLVQVETVDRDDSDSESTNGQPRHTATSSDSPRLFTEWVLEENLHYVPPPKPPATESTATEATESVSSENGSVPVETTNNRPANTATTTVGSTRSEPPNALNDLQNCLANLSLAELRAAADRLEVDIADYVAERERLDGDVAARLAGAMGVTAATAAQGGNDCLRNFLSHLPSRLVTNQASAQPNDAA